MHTRGVIRTFRAPVKETMNVPPDPVLVPLPLVLGSLTLVPGPLPLVPGLFPLVPGPFPLVLWNFLSDPCLLASCIAKIQTFTSTSIQFFSKSLKASPCRYYWLNKVVQKQSWFANFSNPSQPSFIFLVSVPWKIIFLCVALHIYYTIFVKLSQVCFMSKYYCPYHSFWDTFSFIRSAGFYCPRQEEGTRWKKKKTT